MENFNAEEARRIQKTAMFSNELRNILIAIKNEAEEGGCSILLENYSLSDSTIKSLRDRGFIVTAGIINGKKYVISWIEGLHL